MKYICVACICNCPSWVLLVIVGGSPQVMLWNLCPKQCENFFCIPNKLEESIQNECMHYHARSRLVFSACWPFLKTQLLVEFALKWLIVLQSGGIVTKLFLFFVWLWFTRQSHMSSWFWQSLYLQNVKREKVAVWCSHQMIQNVSSPNLQDKLLLILYPWPYIWTISNILMVCEKLATYWKM